MEEEEERKAALLGRHCYFEKDSFSGLRRELFRRHRQRRRCDQVREAYWTTSHSCSERE